MSEQPFCPDHPQADVRHTWDQSHYVLNGYTAGEGIKSNHKYECVECGRVLEAERQGKGERRNDV